MNENDRALRCELVDVARAMNSSGLNQGTSGNLSLRIEGGLLVTPSSLAYDLMEPEDLVAIDFCGQPLPSGLPGHDRRPSSEWRLHADVFADRPDAMAVLHCHPIHATALACHDRGNTPFTNLQAVAGGEEIRCAPYATFGTAELSTHTVKALQDRQACLLAHHGLVSLGRDLDQALKIAVEVETLAQMYLQALQLGEPPLLSASQMEEVHRQFRGLGYGQATNN